MAFVEVGGTRLEIERIAGDARRAALLFLHEGLGCVARWRDFPRAVAEATGRRAVVYSRRGYGLSDAAPRPWPLTFMHEEARGPLPALLEQEGLDDVILVGHSDGASIALIHAGEGGRGVRAVAALAPHVFVEDVCLAAITALRADYDDEATGVRQKLARGHGDIDATFRGWAEAWLDPGFRSWDLTGFLPGVKVPVLVIQGEDDPYGTLAQVDAVCAGVSGPSARVILPGCGHVPQRDQREATLRALVNFVARVG